MIRKYALFAFAFILLLGSGCGLADEDSLFNCMEGEGQIITTELYLSDFSKIKLNIDADVFLSYGEQQEVLVEGQQNVIHEMELSVSDETWEVDFDDCVKDYAPLKVYVTLPEIKELNISSSGSIQGQNALDVGNLRLRINGSGDMNLTLDGADILNTKIKGSGDIKLAGSAEDLELDISGSGDFRGWDLKVEDADVKISGSGDAELHVLDELDVEITGSGDVYYKGDPDLKRSGSGSGDVIDAN